LAAAGAKFRAVTREIKLRADSAGVITVQFARGAANEPNAAALNFLAPIRPCNRPKYQPLPSLTISPS